MPTFLVASPAVVVGLANGSLWLHCGDTDQGLFTGDLGLFGTFARFARPADPDAVTETAQDPEAARRHIEELTRVGALVPGDAPRETAEASPGELVGQVLTPLAIAVDDLAGALCAVSPDVAESVRQETGLGLRARLMACLAAVQAVRQGVGARAPAFMAAQLAALDLPSRGLNIHVGSGSKRLDGWVNLDVWPAELSLDLRAGLPFGDSSAARVYLSHTLEHMVYPRDVMKLLREIHRVLEPGGRVRIVVPDIGAAIDAYVAKDTRFFEGRKEVWPEWKITTRLESFLGYAGVGPYPGMFGYSHKFGYDEETLSRVLTEAGFRDPTRSSFQGSPDPALHVDTASTYAVAHVDGRYYSLFMEAVK